MNFRSPASTELPPRTRRILRKAGNLMVCWGTTSAYAENTFWVAVVIWLARNYLRVRGEYPTYLRPAFLHAELPPRTRRIRLGARLRVRRSGTTSAYAENTNQGPGHGHRGGNYLRVRGEYRIKAERERKLAELPPRTRRILQCFFEKISRHGTTSAYAENTGGKRRRGSRFRNYLRVRGEYFVGAGTDRRGRELPPRTRRIPKISQIRRQTHGTTSAYAENTAAIVGLLVGPPNYLRVRGEYKALIAPEQSPQELPPRTRRIRDTRMGGGTGFGTTSAYAENTLWGHSGLQINGNYLRVRGEYPK